MKGRFRVNGGSGIVLALVSVFFLALAAFFGFRGSSVIRDTIANLSAPAGAGAEYALLSRDALVAQLKEAKQELSHVRSQGVLMELLADENRKLREAARAVALAPGVTARVTARPPRTHYDSLVLDAGSRDGILVNGLVVVEGIALGRIASVGERTALVELFSNPGSEHDVIVGEPPAVSIAHGLGGGSFELTVPREVSVSAGDIVRFPETNPLTLGVVRGVSGKPTDTSKTVRFAIPISFSALDFVEILPP